MTEPEVVLPSVESKGGLPPVAPAKEGLPGPSAMPTSAPQQAVAPEPPGINLARTGERKYYLRLGSSGPEVAWLKRELNEWIRSDEGQQRGLSALTIGSDPDNEIFDEQLEAVVRAFQEARGIMVDGVVGFRTMRQLDEFAIGYLIGEAKKHRDELKIDDEVYQQLLERDRQDFRAVLGSLGYSAGHLGNLGDDVSFTLSDEQLRAFQDSNIDVKSLFGNSSKWLPKIIGLAEGTHSIRIGGDGETIEKTPEWNGHSDPVNGQRNVGSYSVQTGTHGDMTPEEADIYYSGILLNMVPDFIASFRGATGKDWQATDPKALLLLIVYLDMGVQSPARLRGQNGMGSIEKMCTVFERISNAQDPDVITAALTDWRFESFRGRSGEISSNFNNPEALRLDQERRVKALMRGVDLMIKSVSS